MKTGTNEQEAGKNNEPPVASDALVASQTQTLLLVAKVQVANPTKTRASSVKAHFFVNTGIKKSIFTEAHALRLHPVAIRHETLLVYTFGSSSSKLVESQLYVHKLYSVVVSKIIQLYSIFR